MKISCAVMVAAQAVAVCAGLTTDAVAQGRPSSAELQAVVAVEAARKAGEPELYALLKTMPKGGELHMHLSGAVYAETFIAEGAKLGLCVASVDAGSPAVPVGQGAVRFVKPSATGCATGQVPASDAFKRQPLYDDLVDSFSMRSFVPTQGINGHDQFFATFERFGSVQGVGGEWLDEVATRAAAQNEQYLEIMHTPPFIKAATLGYKLGWPEGAEHSVTHEQLAQLRDALLKGGLRQEVADDSRALDAMEQQRNEIERCKETAGSERSAGCDVSTRYLYQVLRGFAPQQVFAQTLLGFETASADPRFVGINFVMPEDGYLSMRDYHLQMQMLEYLHSVYPKVHIALHAGEVAPGLVPPDGLTFHIREAVELAHAERIGHGVDVLYEKDSAGLLKDMAEKHVAVEINLTSNDVILGIKGSDHPLAAYRKAHVPFTLSTDDEGVSRIDLTHEYVRAVEEQGLGYLDLKQSARSALEFSFLPGESLWRAKGQYTQRINTCAAAITAKSEPAESCRKFLQENKKAAEEWELEQRLANFEDKLTASRL
ncbi:MAG: adenosine deaminase [Acidobacteriaceae bacterium]|nr:adenosine deaminase [Acidobacteriaceae bacterium]